MKLGFLGGYLQHCMKTAMKYGKSTAHTNISIRIKFKLNTPQQKKSLWSFDVISPSPCLLRSRRFSPSFSLLFYLLSLCVCLCVCVCVCACVHVCVCVGFSSLWTGGCT